MQGHNKKLYASFLAVVFLNGACNKVGDYGSSSSQSKNKGGKTSAEVKKNKDDGKGVRLSLALPKSFEESASKDEAIDEPKMDASFEKAFSSGYIQMACDDKGFGDEGLAEMKERKVRAIIELTLNQRINHASQPGAEEPSSPDGSDDSAFPFPDKDPSVGEASQEPPKEDKFALTSKKGEGPVENKPDGDQGPAENFPAEKESVNTCESGSGYGPSDGGYGESTEENYGSSGGGYGETTEGYGEGSSTSDSGEWSEGYAVEHVMMPYTCEGKATIRVVNLEKGTEYSLDARLFTAEGNLAYAGATDGFVPEDGKQVDLVMAPVENQQVDINVIFADAVSDDVKKDDEAGSTKGEDKLEDESKEPAKEDVKEDVKEEVRDIAPDAGPDAKN